MNISGMREVKKTVSYTTL